MQKLLPFLNKIIGSGNEPVPRFDGDKDGCWIWQGAKTGANKKTTGGYANFSIAGKTRYAYNLSYVLLELLKNENLSEYTDVAILNMVDDLRKGGKKEASHICNHRDCVNPSHQLRESHTENMRRAKTLGFQKLSDVAVREIRRRYVKDTHHPTIHTGNSKQLAAEFGVTRGYICSIARRFYRANVI